MPLDFDFGPAELAAVEQARVAFAPLRERRAELRRVLHGEEGFYEPLWQACADAGFFSALVPREHGGSGAGLLCAALILEEMFAGRILRAGLQREQPQ
jgi:alkylation response protein AidB-like acyl-CoA dehydrogenase